MASLIIKEQYHDGQIVRLTLNAPKANVLDSAMMSELQGVLDSLKNEPQLKLLQFCGAGDNFSFGASVAEHTRERAPEMLKQFHGLFYTLIDLALPTAALVWGQCLGGGLELALICNFIFVDKTARLGQPEISLAVFPPPASLILPMKIGQAKADDLLLTGNIISGEQAQRTELINDLYDSREAMLEGVEQWAKKEILPKSASSLRYAVRAARYSFNKKMREGLAELEKMYVNELMATDDANEGISSFIERRKPVWKNS